MLPHRAIVSLLLHFSISGGPSEGSEAGVGAGVELEGQLRDLNRCREPYGGSGGQFEGSGEPSKGSEGPTEGSSGL